MDFCKKATLADLVECDLKMVVSTPDEESRFRVHRDNVLDEAGP